MKGLRVWLVLLLLASCTVWGGESDSNSGSTKTKNRRKKKNKKGGDKNKGKDGSGELSGITLVEAEKSKNNVGNDVQNANDDKGSVCFVIASLPWTFGPYQTQGHELSKQLHARGYKIYWWAFTLSVPEGR
jgi:hypothetical protein